MNGMRDHCGPRALVLIVVVISALVFCSPIAASEGTAAEGVVAEGAAVEGALLAESGRPGPVGLGVSGATAGITTDYFEETVTEALIASNIFSEVDDSSSSEVIMRMMRVDGVFGSPEITENTPYFLSIRVVKIDTPSFSVRMHVSMDVIWILYRTADKTEIFRESISSTYTGGMFEGGVAGANRVRVALEGAARENIRIGVEKLAAIDFGG